MPRESIFFQGDQIFGRIDRLTSPSGGVYFRAVIAGKHRDYGQRPEDWGSVACASLEAVRGELLAIDRSSEFFVVGPWGNTRVRLKAAMVWLFRVLIKATTPRHSPSH